MALINFARDLINLGDAGIAHFARAYSLRDAIADDIERSRRLIAALSVLQIINNARDGDLPRDAAELLHGAQIINWLWSEVQLMILNAHLESQAADRAVRFGFGAEEVQRPDHAA